MAGGGPILQNNAGEDNIPTEGSRRYAIIVCIFASLGGLFFGYDQGVTGGVLVMKSFLNDYCVGWHEQTYAECTTSSGELPTRWLDFTLCTASCRPSATSWRPRATRPAGRSCCSRPSMFLQVLVAMFLQVLQQATGINPMFTYGGLIFKDVVGDGILSVLILSIVNFVSTVPAMRWVDTFGRRQLLLIGAVGMVLGHVLSGITFTVGCDGNTDDSGCSKAAGYVIILGTSFFIFNFAISWGPVCWIYPAEIFPMNVRAKAVSLSTMANWVTGTCMTWVVKLFPSLNINGVFFLFCGTCLVSGVFVFYHCPETKGLLLEDIEKLFERKKAPRPHRQSTPASRPRS